MKFELNIPKELENAEISHNNKIVVVTNIIPDHQDKHLGDEIIGSATMCGDNKADIIFANTNTPAKMKMVANNLGKKMDDVYTTEMCGKVEIKNGVVTKLDILSISIVYKQSFNKIIPNG